MGDVRPGDTLFDDHCETCRVLAISQVMHDRQSYRMRFSDVTSVEADAEQPVENADRGGHGSCLAHASLALETHRDALPRRDAVRDERRLEGDDGPTLGERMAHLVRYVQDVHGIDPSFATQRAAAARASSGPPTR